MNSGKAHLRGRSVPLEDHDLLRGPKNLRIKPTPCDSEASPHSFIHTSILVYIERPKETSPFPKNKGPPNPFESTVRLSSPVRPSMLHCKTLRKTSGTTMYISLDYLIQQPQPAYYDSSSSSASSCTGSFQSAWSCKWCVAARSGLEPSYLYLKRS